MNTWPVTAVVSSQSQLGGTKIRIILNISLILHYVTCLTYLSVIGAEIEGEGHDMPPPPTSRSIKVRI